MTSEKANYEKELEEYKKLLLEEKEQHTRTKIKLLATKRELHSITTSKSYKLAKSIAYTKHIVKVVRDQTFALTPKRYKLINDNRKLVRRAYESNDFNNDFSIEPTAKLAVVLHLYYPELLGYFVEKLKNIGNLKYDLFVTIPTTKKESIASVKKALPNARISVVPNCGRDVLPFVEVIKRINELGYTKVLKLHSKKSPHREDGDAWRDQIVGNLLPEDQSVQSEIQRTLNKRNTAIIGPAGQYLSLLVNFSSTGHHTKKLLDKLFDKKFARELFSNSDEYGFFAGTMFWVRVDALLPIINTISAVDFEPELGQEDSTLAHALERLFSVIPELNTKNIYEVSASEVLKLDYHTTNIPDWSEAALEN